MNLPTVLCLAAALAVGSCLSGCGGGQEAPGTLDLGGGLSMTPDGAIVDSTRVAPAAAQ